MNPVYSSGPSRQPLSRAEIRAVAEAWYQRQLEKATKAHRGRWVGHRAWVENYLQEELRQRLTAIGWKGGHV